MRQNRNLVQKPYSPSNVDLNNDLRLELNKIRMKPSSISRTILMFTKSINTPSLSKPCSFVNLHYMNPSAFPTFNKVKKNIFSLEKNGLIQFVDSDYTLEYNWLITSKGNSFLYHLASKHKTVSFIGNDF